MSGREYAGELLLLSKSFCKKFNFLYLYHKKTEITKCHILGVRREQKPKCSQWWMAQNPNFEKWKYVFMIKNQWELCSTVETKKMLFDDRLSKLFIWEYVSLWLIFPTDPSRSIPFFLALNLEAWCMNFLIWAGSPAVWIVVGFGQ